MEKVIILNAPPGAGKDTIGNRIAMIAPWFCRMRSFKKPMFEIARAMLGARLYKDFMDAYNDREQKEKPQRFLNGKSPRQFMIWISEDVIKPQFGSQYFGVRMVEQIRECDDPVIITDGGFKDEIKPLIGAGFEVHICRLHRMNFTFDGDSRDYLNMDGYHYRLKTHDFLLVDGDPTHTAEEIIETCF